MIISIYKILNNINGKMYIGQTSNSIENRFRHHKYENIKDCIKLHNAMNKHGRDNFSIDCIAITSSEEIADYLESTYIKEYNSMDNGYNICSGGRCNRRGIKVSEETRNKMSIAKRNISKITRSKMSASQKKRRLKEKDTING